MFLKLLLLTIILAGAAVAGLAITMLVKPDGKFPDTHISHNKEMRKRGISCAQDTDLGCKPGEGMSGCAGCSHNSL